MGGHKAKRKKEKKKKKKRSSSESSNDDEVWVEKESKEKEKHSTTHQTKRDDWLSNSDDIFATITRKQLKPELVDKKEDRVSIDEMGRSSRELNPYWKDGGSGLPEEDAIGKNKSSGTVGDLGLSWLKRALDRAKQTSEEEKRPLEDVVAPVWGSLDKLLSLIKEAEDKISYKSSRRYEDAGPSNSDRRYSSDQRQFRKPHQDDKESHRYNERHHQKDDNRRRKEFIKPSEYSCDSIERRRDDKGRHYDKSEDRIKPKVDSERLDKLKSSYRSGHRPSWKKSSAESVTLNQRIDCEKKSVTSLESSSDCRREERMPSPSPEPVSETQEIPEIITQDEMNQIAAQILKAEMFGNKDEVNELKCKLQRAQSWLAGSKSKSTEHKEVLLVQTDRYGFSRPVASSSSSQPHSKKRSKLETHSDGKRVRYFKDDDNYSLQDLVHQEKFVSVADQNEMYAKLSKGVGQRQDDDDFEEGGGREKSEEWSEFNRRQRAALESTKRERVLNTCTFCLDSQSANRKLVISLMDKVYLSVPPHQSLTDGHCLILPIQHTPCSTLLDEDVWEEVMDLRRLVVKMFLEEDKDVIFYESAKNLNKFPHMILNCVPVPKEIGDDAPIYFKKALLECEMEWSNNKKVVDLKGRDVRKAVPKGLSYFAVDFGLQSGYAHVIEDERLFPRNFAQEIIGGMMDMDHSIWRKQKKDDQEVQIAKTQLFIKKFKEFTSKKNF